ncbi:uncharacterized protein LOC103794340 [Callithrix jacchus]
MKEGTILPLARDTKPWPVPSRVAGDSGTITLRCKDLRVLQLEIEDWEATLDIARSIEALSSLELAITSCSFFYHPNCLRLDDSWHFLSPERYYKRVALEVGAVVEARGGGSWARKRRGKRRRDRALPGCPRPGLSPPCAADQRVTAERAPDRYPEEAQRGGPGAAASCASGGLP